MGLPVFSNLPFSSTSSLFIKVSITLSHLTPRILSISFFVIGCLYAIIDNVSRAAVDKLLVPFC